MKILYLGNKLSKKGFNSTYIETLGALLEIEGFTLIYASDKINQFHRMIDMVFTTLFNINKVDYVIIDTYSTFSFYYSLIISQICRLFSKKYIVILHGGNLPIRLKSNPFFCDLTFKNASYLVAPSGYLHEIFNAKYPKNSIHIPNAIEISNYSFSEKEFVIPKLLWVRSFSTIYNPKMAIDVLSQLILDFPEAQLCMVGPDSENLIEIYKNYALQHNVKVTFTGKLSKEEWIELSKEYTVFINTTHFDNTPISIIEAMALGFPIVSTNVGGIPFLLKNEKNALLVDDNDVLGMTDAIKKIFKNINFAKKISLNSRSTAEAFDWNVVKYKWFELLK
jgi:glycosyltransferase involved in cell wall biosynthesis